MNHYAGIYVPGLGLCLLGGLKYFLEESEDVREEGGCCRAVVWPHPPPPPPPPPLITEPDQDLNFGGGALEGE